MGTEYRGRPWRFVPALGLLLGWFTAISAGQEAAPVTLAWKLPAGTQLRLDFTQTTDTFTTINKYRLRVKMEMASELSWNVVAVDAAGVMDLDQTLDRMRVTLTPAEGSQPIMFDSASDERLRGTALDVANALKPLVGVTYRIRMNPRGEVLESRLADPASGADAEGGEPPADPQAENSEGAAALQPPDVNEVLRQALAVMPAEAVEPGASWTSARESTLPVGKIQVQTQYTYRGSEQVDGQSLERIDADSRLQLTPAEGTRTKITLKQQQATGTLWFDSTAGRLAASQMQLELVTHTPFRDEQITSRLTSTLDLKIAPLEQ